MTKFEIEELFNPKTFDRPLLITTVDGFTVPVTSVYDTLVGQSMLVVKWDGRIHHFPFHAIVRVSEAGEMLG